MSLEQFLDIPDGSARSLVVVNRTEPEPIQRLVKKVFDPQGLDVSELSDEQYDEDTVLLVGDGEILASSTLQELENAILLVNSDLFTTGTRKLDDVEVPAVVEGLTDYRFRLRGYPESDTEKFLLVVISRRIEKLAATYGEGTLRSSFQRLSRIEDERGTREVYETLGKTDVDVHVYGRPDWVPSPRFPVTMHGGYKRDFRNSWFVLYNPPEEKRDEYDAAVLVAIETEPRVWDGFWTYDADTVETVAAYIRQNL